MNQNRISRKYLIINITKFDMVEALANDPIKALANDLKPLLEDDKWGECEVMIKSRF